MNRCTRSCLIFFVLAMWIGTLPAAPMDLIVRGGTVIDGSGAPGRTADVGIRDGKIVAIGELRDLEAKDVIDASSLIVAPGFIDVHNHVAETLPAHGPFLNEGYLTQGVTTFVGGVDGVYAPAPLRDTIARLRREGITTNYAFYIGHNGIRSQVMGSARRDPTPLELERMKALVREGMRMGCLGFSTGLMYQPGMFSKTYEVIDLAREVRPFGGTYDTHTRDPVFDLIGSNREALEVGRAAGIAVKLGHIKPVGLANRGRSRDEIALVEQARAAGHDVVADQYPYDGAAVGTLDVLVRLPGTQGDSLHVPEHEAVREALRDRSRRRALQEMSENGIDGGFSWIKAAGYGSVRIVDAPDAPRLNGEYIQLLAAERGQPPFDLIADLIVEYPRPIVITLGALDESDLRAELAMPWNMIGSDGAYLDPDSQEPLHPRYTGSFPRVLGHYVRDVKLFTLEEAVRKMTSLPADHLNLADRGRIEIGHAADITVFDAATVRDRSTWTNPAALSEGVRHVIVNGIPALRDGKLTGAAPGRLLKPQLKVRKS